MKQQLRSLLVNVLITILVVLIVGYLVARAWQGGNDIKVYMYAAEQLCYHQNIYVQNPFNVYLYSPLFALMMRPLTWVNVHVARVIWMFLNVAFAIRIWFLLSTFTKALNARNRRIWTVLLILLSAGYLNHNLVLGQLTILILWLTIEGVIAASNGKTLKGSALIALGINFKIIPLLALLYFGLRKQFKAFFLALALLSISLILPGIFVGFGYNASLLKEWETRISPARPLFAFENNDGCQSLNALLPAYLFDFSTYPTDGPPHQSRLHYPRRIASVSYAPLSMILTGLRLLFLLFFILAVLPRYLWKTPTREIPVQWFRTTSDITPGHRSNDLFWHLAMLCLITLIIFPHQMKYSMLYFVPAGSYILYYYLIKSQQKVTLSSAEIWIRDISVCLLLLLFLMGRSIIGSHLVDILDYYHVIGFINIIFTGILWACRPEKLAAVPGNS